MTTEVRCKIVEIPRVMGFHLKSVDDALTILVDKVATACEKQGVFLHSLTRLKERDVYNACKSDHNLFDVEKVQMAFQAFEEIHLVKSDYYEMNGVTLRMLIQGRANAYIEEGDCIAAALLQGHPVSFEENVNRFRLEFMPEEADQFEYDSYELENREG